MHVEEPAWTRVLRWTLVSIFVFVALGFTFDAMPVWMTPDSVEYLAMANSLAHADGVRGFDGAPAGMWGPGFSALLAPGIALGYNAFDVLPWLHAWIWTLLLLGVVVPRLAAPLVALAVATSRGNPRRCTCDHGHIEHAR